MKTLLKNVIIMLLLTFCVKGFSQDTIQRGFQLSPRIGYDMPTYKNNTPYIDYKGGIDLGLSLDYYWNWFGLGFDFDYIKNKPESTYPTTNLYDVGGAVFTNFNKNEDGITRLFFGIGPDFRYLNKKQTFSAELNTRLGIGSIKGGETLLEGRTSTTSPYKLLNYHAGYDDSVFSTKLQARFTYFITPNFGINLGAYYLQHYGVEEKSFSGMSAAYQPFTSNAGDYFIDQTGLQTRTEPCDCDISSIGVFAGVTFKFNKKEKVCPVCKEDHTPHCCTTCGCNITITAKDKFTGETLPNTDVVITDLNGNIVHSATTNSYGAATFNDVQTDDYLIRGKLHQITLEENTLTKADFKDCQKTSGIQKVILYTDENFILQGKVVECNTTNGIDNVDIILKDKLKAGQKNTLSDANGSFIFHLTKGSTFALKGNKDGYFSNEVEVSTNSKNRNSTLFIDFEMCVNPCGKAITLDNINFDLDDDKILPAAIPDLQRVVRLMQANPTIQVEMSSHTDSQGSDSYNLGLSQRRADATVNYLITQGISRSRLIARGAGETELLNSKCKNGVPCTDEEHRVNRRTEFKVVCF